MAWNQLYKQYLNNDFGKQLLKDLGHEIDFTVKPKTAKPEVNQDRQWNIPASTMPQQPTGGNYQTPMINGLVDPRSQPGFQTALNEGGRLVPPGYVPQQQAPVQAQSPIIPNKGLFS